MEDDLKAVILAAAGNRADQVSKAIDDYFAEDSDATPTEGPEASNAAVEGADAPDAPVEEAVSPETP